jgi:hypothetical protein
MYLSMLSDGSKKTGASGWEVGGVNSDVEVKEVCGDLWIMCMWCF